MGFRLIACIVAFLALTVIFDEIHKVDRENKKRTLELHRRVTEIEEKKKVPPLVEEDFMCTPWPSGPFGKIPSSLDRDLDEQDFKKDKKYKR